MSELREKLMIYFKATQTNAEARKMTSDALSLVAEEVEKLPTTHFGTQIMRDAVLALLKGE